MALLHTYCTYNDNVLNFYPIVDDALASLIRATNFTPVVISDINTVGDFLSAIEPYVEDTDTFRRTEFLYSYGDNLTQAQRERIEFVESVFTNMVFISREDNTSVTEQEAMSFAGKKANLIGANYYERALACPKSSALNVRTPWTFETNFVNFYGNLDFYVPVFMESEVEDGYQQVLPSTYRLLIIRYSSDHSITINRSSTLGTTALEWFLYSEIPDEPPTPPTPPSEDDPYSPGGYSGGGGGPNPDGTGTTGTGGLHDDTSDVIPTPSLPSDATISSGLFTAYNPSASQLASFASALWNMQVSDINDVLRFLFGGDAFNAVIGLHLLPVSPSVGGSQNIKLGNWDTGVSAPKIDSQYKQVPFGSVLLPEYWGNCIDYAPYTRIQLALPYIGIVDVDTDDVLGSTNTLTYNIDVLSGAICATLHCVKFNLSSVIYQWSGACGVSLPFSGASYNSVLSAIAGVAAAGMGFAAMAAGPIGAALPAAALAAGAGAFSAGSAASIMGSMKGKVQKSGSFGANSGALGIMTPYFILTRPVQSVPASWQADKGYPANISAQLGTVTGYTEVSEINLECSGTEAEKKEIIDLLKKGVLF